MIGAVACVIPARLAASRFPGKLLRPLEGEPVLIHTLRRAREADCFAEILCLTDSPEISALARAAGFEAKLTGEAANGTERIARNLNSIASHSIVNLQGDEPAFPAQALRTLCSALREEPEYVHVLVHDGEPGELDKLEENRVKAGLGGSGFVRDFYRVNPTRPVEMSRLQMGAYGYTKDYLRAYLALPPSAREIAESHEMLRDLELAPIRAHACAHSCQAVDVPGDMEKAGSLLRRMRMRDPLQPAGNREQRVQA